MRKIIRIMLLVFLAISLYGQDDSTEKTLKNRDAEIKNFSINNYENISKLIPENKWHIIKGNQKDNFLGQNVSAYWIPTKAEVIKSLNILDHYFRTEKSLRLNYDFIQIIKNISKYDCQIIGIERNGIKSIYFNFLIGFSNDKNINENIITVRDGGWHFWRVEINLNTNSTVYFYFNGNA